MPKELCDTCLEEMRDYKGYLAVGMKRAQLWRFVSGQPDYDVGERNVHNRFTKGV